MLSTLATGGGGSNGGGGSPGTLQFSVSTLDAIEGTVANILVNRSGGGAGVARVDYATANRTAEGGSDFPAATGTLTWAGGLTGNQTISIAITDDTIAESLESFTVTLSNVSGATLGGNTTVTVNIVDNDSASLAAYGPITELNSATVNGIRYDTDTAAVLINGLAGTASDLQLGQVVTLGGEANFSDATGRADIIVYSALVIGPVDSIDTTLKQLIVMGQTVLTNADTVFGPGIDPDTLTGLSVGATAQISGLQNSSGDIVATRIELDTSSTRVQLVGVVSGLDLANLLFSVNRLTVDYGSAMVIDLPGGMPAVGLQIIVRGSLTDGILVVDEIASLANLTAAPGERLHLGGIVTRFASPTDFDLNGFPVTTDMNTLFVNGDVDDLQADAEIVVDGQEVTGSDTVLAGTIAFGRPAFPGTTVPFDFQNFTNISVFGFSRVTVSQGPDYSVEATGNADIINDIQVTQNGDTVTFGNDKTQLMNVIVTMPLLDRVDVLADSLATVTLNDFNQPQMTINIDGVSLLRGNALVINNLTASVAGVSLLDLGEITGLSSASIDISDVSQATLNMGVGSALSGSVSTGQGTGVSRLFYYGTNTTTNVTTDAQSIVTRLGDTRP